MAEEILFERGTTLVRRLTLTPGEAMPWHRDPYHRVTVVLTDGTLAIEHHDGSPGQRFNVRAGQVDWDEPSEKLHRGVNAGSALYEEVTVFLLDRPGAIPQPGEP